MPTMASPSASAAKNPSRDRKSTRLNSSHLVISYAVFCLKKKNPEPGDGVHSSQRLPARRSSPGSEHFLVLGTAFTRIFFFTDWPTPEFCPLPLHGPLPI